MKHNHCTRDIKPKGECPACDKYYEQADLNEYSLEQVIQEVRRSNFTHVNGGSAMADNMLDVLLEEIKNLKEKLNRFGESSTDLKARFRGEHYYDSEVYNPDIEDYTIAKRYIPWTLQKQIFKEMCEYVRNRKEEDYRP